ncbi:MAG: radical SAM protein [archaeon]
MKGLLSLGAEALKSNFQRPPFPFKLTFAVTYRCNSRCATCSIWRRKSKDELSLREMEKFFSENRGFRWVAITGGEPFLRKDLFGICKAMSRTNPLSVVTITTNGLLPGRVVKETKRILRLRIPRLILTLSCDGPGPVHDRIRGVPGNFEKLCGIYSSLRGLQNENFRIFFGFTLSFLNSDQFEPLFSELNSRFPEISYDRIHANVFHYSPHFYMNRRIPGSWKKKTERAIGEILEKRRFSLLDPLGFLERKYLEGSVEYLRTGKSPLPCKACSASLFLDPQGTLYPCTIWDRKLGNIRKDPRISSLWNSEFAKETAKAAEKLDCPNCWTPCEAYQTISGNFLRAAFWNIPRRGRKRAQGTRP